MQYMEISKFGTVHSIIAERCQYNCFRCNKVCMYVCMSTNCIKIISDMVMGVEQYFIEQWTNSDSIFQTDWFNFPLLQMSPFQSPLIFSLFCEMDYQISARILTKRIKDEDIGLDSGAVENFITSLMDWLDMHLTGMLRNLQQKQTSVFRLNLLTVFFRLIWKLT